MGIQGMVTRSGWNKEVRGASQRITVDEALADDLHTVVGGATVFQA